MKASLPTPLVRPATPDRLRAWRLDGAEDTLVFGAIDDRIPGLLYWGDRIDDSIPALEIARGLWPAPPVSKLDGQPAITMWPESEYGDQALPIAGRAGGMCRLDSVIRDTDEAGHPRLRFLGQRLAVGVAVGENATDAANTIEMAWHWCLRGTNTLAVHTECAHPVGLGEWISAPVVSVSGIATCGGDFVVDAATVELFSGYWCHEWRSHRHVLRAGTHTVGSECGRSSHEHAPFAVLENGAGGCIGAAVQWCSSWQLHVVCDAYGGIHLHAQVPMGERSATLLLVRAANAHSMTHRFHDLARRIAAPIGDAPLPIHVNTWEGMYMDVNADRLQGFSDSVAALRDATLAQLPAGHAAAFRVVLDDGWFPARHDDQHGLGRWNLVDGEKFPAGLLPAIAHAQKLGLDFGLWIEPEMVSPDVVADLQARSGVAHVVLGARRSGAELGTELGGELGITLGRGQYAANIVEPAVQETIVRELCDLLRAHPGISYVKWDMNRMLPPHDARGYREAVLAMMAAVLGEFPPGEFVIESCASGGGRVDFDILRFCTRFWSSDNNDPVSHWDGHVQMARFFPPWMLGFHVAASPSHQTGRMSSFALRAWLAAAGGGWMGVELDPTTLSSADRDTLAQACAFFCEWHAVVRHGKTWHLSQSPLQIMAFAGEERAFLIIFAREEAPYGNALSPVVRLGFLRADRQYLVRCAFATAEWRDQLPLGLYAPTAALHEAGVVVSGAVLRTVGLRMPPATPWQVMILKLESVAF